MRRWLVVLVLLAACGEDKTAELLGTTSAPTTSRGAAESTRLVTTTVAPTTTTTTTVATTIAEQPVVVEGQGQMQSAPFQLQGGRYRSTWQTFNNCYYSADLKPGGVLGLTVLNADGATTGETFVNGVKAGEHYINMITGPVPRCRWKVTLTRA